MVSQSKQLKLEKITAALAANPQGISPKQIARITGIKHSTVRTLISQIVSVEHICYGLYHLHNSGGDRGIEFEMDIKVHNLTMTCQTGYTGTEINTTLAGKTANYVFGVSSTGNAYIQFATDYPIVLSSIDTVFQLFKSLAKEYSIVVTEEDTLIPSIEMNNDNERIRMDGMTSLTVTRLQDTYKIYQKTKAVRIEHKITVPITLRTVFDMLLNKPDNTQMEDKINKLERQQVINNQLLCRVLEQLTTYNR
jgi:hypothetical protein